MYTLKLDPNPQTQLPIACLRPGFVVNPHDPYGSRWSGPFSLPEVPEPCDPTRMVISPVNDIPVAKVYGGKTNCFDIFWSRTFSNVTFSQMMVGCEFWIVLVVCAFSVVCASSFRRDCQFFLFMSWNQNNRCTPTLFNLYTSVHFVQTRGIPQDCHYVGKKWSSNVKFWVPHQTNLHANPTHDPVAKLVGWFSQTLGCVRTCCIYIYIAHSSIIRFRSNQ